MSGIIKAYCINLASESNRRLHCEREYRKTEIPYEFLEAVDGRIADIQPDPAFNKAQEDRWKLIDETALTLSFFNRSTNSPERACALSHFKAWKNISEVSDELKDSFFMVNEDDFNVLTTEGLSEAIEELRKLDFDMVYLGYRGGDFTPPSIKARLQQVWHRIKYALSQKTNEDKFRRNLVLLGRTRVNKQSEYFHHAGMTWGGHAYLLNRRGALKLVNYNENLRFLPDEAFRYAILDGNFKVGMSKIKYFGCDTQFGSALRSEDDHTSHHQLFPSD